MRCSLVILSILRSVLLIFLSVLPQVMFGQNEIIKGTITDQAGKPLQGVTVAAIKSGTTTMTSDDGSFTINAVASDSLMISFVGYLSQTLPVSEVHNRVIKLSADELGTGLSEVVVMGYKNVLRKNVAGAVASVNMQDLQNIPTSTVLDVLAGKVAGMQTIVRAGVPGGATGGLVIRGNSSLSAADDASGLSNPLYIVDGVPMSLSDLAGFDATQNDFFATLNPNDFESIDVLKDAAATAIYGARGANGVIIIKTKRGRKGKTRIAYNGAYGVNLKPEKLKVFIGEAEREEKLRLYEISMRTLFGDQAWIDVRNGLEVYGYMLPPVLTDKNNPAFNGAYDYQALFYQNGFNQRHDIAIDGGNELGAYRIGLGYYDEKGILSGIGFKRFSVNSSVVSDIGKYVHNDFVMNFALLDRRGGSTDRMRTFPTSPTQLPSSLYYRTQQELDLLSGRLSDVYQKNGTYQLRFSDALRIKFLKNFTWDNQGSLFIDLGRKQYFVPTTAAYNSLSYAQSWNSENFSFTGSSVLSYFKEVNDHEIAGLLGTEMKKDRQSTDWVDAEDGPSDYIKVIKGYKKESINGGSDVVKSNMLSYFANLSYGYKDRYKIEGVIRRDGHSRFGADNKWATFPSLSTYWIFTREPWMKSDVLTFGKLRFSYGRAGQIDPDPLLQYNSFIAINNIGSGIGNIYSNKLDVKTYNGKTVLISDFNKIANTSLSWSTSEEVNYGLDLEFFKERLYINTNLYSRYEKGLIFTSALSPFMGFNSIRSNLVDMISNGYELSIMGYLFPRTNSFQWDWTVNLARNKTVIAKLGNGGRDYINGDYAFVVGEPSFQYYTYEYLGPLQNEDDLPVNPMTGTPMTYLWADAGLAIGRSGKIFPGMPLFTDVNGDYQIDGADYGYDKKIIPGKSPEPKVMGGVSTNIRWKQFSFRVQSSFAFGHYIFNTSLQEMLAQYDDNIAFFQNALYDFGNKIRFWEYPGDDAYYPMRFINYSDGGSARSFRRSSMFIEKGDYWNIDNITIAYSLPARIASKLYMRNAQVYCTMRDVYMWKKSNVPDPRQVSKTGYYVGQGYPITKNISLGININF